MFKHFSNILVQVIYNFQCHSIQEFLEDPVVHNFQRIYCKLAVFVVLMKEVYEKHYGILAVHVTTIET
jgi:hypothetical protein